MHIVTEYWADRFLVCCTNRRKKKTKMGKKMFFFFFFKCLDVNDCKYLILQKKKKEQVT